MGSVTTSTSSAPPETDSPYPAPGSRSVVVTKRVNVTTTTIPFRVVQRVLGWVKFPVNNSVLQVIGLDTYLSRWILEEGGRCWRNRERETKREKSRSVSLHPKKEKEKGG